MTSQHYIRKYIPIIITFLFNIVIQYLDGNVLSYDTVSANLVDRKAGALRERSLLYLDL
mgnify:CR=1 FL=1